MRLFQKAKDGGPDSNVTGYYIIEWKPVFSIVLLHFSDGSREAYHNHAFNAVSWVISGLLQENHLKIGHQWHYPSWIPFLTMKHTFHKVFSVGDSWAFSLREPWEKTWREYLDNENRFRTLTHGRKEI